MHADRKHNLVVHAQAAVRGRHNGDEHARVLHDCMGCGDPRGERHIEWHVKRTEFVQPDLNDLDVHVVGCHIVECTLCMCSMGAIGRGLLEGGLGPDDGQRPVWEHRRVGSQGGYRKEVDEDASSGSMTDARILSFCTGAVTYWM